MTPVQMTPEEFWPKWFPEHTKKFWQDWRSVAWEFAEAYYQYRSSLGEGGCEHRMTTANSDGEWCRSCGEIVKGDPFIRQSRRLSELLESASIMLESLPNYSASSSAYQRRERLEKAIAGAKLPAPASASGDGGKE